MILGQKLVVTAQIVSHPHVLEPGQIVEAGSTSGAIVHLRLTDTAYVKVALVTPALRARVRPV